MNYSAELSLFIASVEKMTQNKQKIWGFVFCSDERHFLLTFFPFFWKNKLFRQKLNSNAKMVWMTWTMLTPFKLGYCHHTSSHDNSKFANKTNEACVKVSIFRNTKISCVKCFILQFTVETEKFDKCEFSLEINSNKSLNTTIELCFVSMLIRKSV